MITMIMFAMGLVLGASLVMLADAALFKKGEVTMKEAFEMLIKQRGLIEDQRDLIERQDKMIEAQKDTIRSVLGESSTNEPGRVIN